MAADGVQDVSPSRHPSSTHPDNSTFAAARLQRSSADHISQIVEEHSQNTKCVTSDAQLLAGTSSTLKVPEDDRPSSQPGLEGPSADHVSKPEESATPDSVSVDLLSPLLPPKSTKLSKSLLFEGGTPISPPEIPRRSSVPNSGLTWGKTVSPRDRNVSSTAAVPQNSSAADENSQKSSGSDLPRDVDEHAAPVPFPRTSPKISPKPAPKPTVESAHLGSSDASRTAAIPVKPASVEERSPNAATSSDRILSESEVKTDDVLPIGDCDPDEALTSRRPVSEMKRFIDARTTSVQQETDTKPSVPTRKLVIPSAFQN